MASSASGQYEPNRALWLATRAGKMEPSCPLGTTRCIPQEKFPQKPYTKSFIDQVCSVKMAGYWPCFFFASLWTSTSSLSINTQKKNLANIQPSWAGSITHKYCSQKLNYGENRSNGKGDKFRKHRYWTSLLSYMETTSCVYFLKQWLFSLWLNKSLVIK